MLQRLNPHADAWAICCRCYAAGFSVVSELTLEYQREGVGSFVGMILKFGHELLTKVVESERNNKTMLRCVPNQSKSEIQQVGTLAVPTGVA
jgi:hypothetical protein